MKFLSTLALTFAFVDGFKSPVFVPKRAPSTTTSLSAGLGSLLTRPIVAGVAGVVVAGTGLKVVLDRPSRPYDENSVATEYGKFVNICYNNIY